ncbi:hypothetical protein GCM10010123_42250 [Pilimelia anulata]|uniref:Uncharacterized protein n=1 Tax=Pilimelia anulata TaxID=53371 RepID=A0A8J3BB79_9ACTN|nr:hypothetical protein [Pilimelia anulata]GGK07842.1 hypothetical protein GCM10010123_42250 [Pilimelia anulata]
MSSRPVPPRGSRLLLAAAAAAVVPAVLDRLRRSRYAQGWERTNFHGRTVSLAAGPALATVAAGSAALGAGTPAAAGAALVAGLGSGAVGLYDDIVGARPEQKADKGFRGHLAALRAGRVSAGLVKLAGVGAASVAAAALLSADRTDRRGVRARRAGRALDVALGAGVIAGTANLVNLLDLRPGRALKASALLGAPLAAGPAGGLVAGPLGTAAGLLPADLDERVMLGDCGANAMGALLGTALARRCGPGGRAALLAGLVALNLASERVSFTKVIERTAGLRQLDQLGRRPR